jgi:hypothetical protein
MTFADWLDAERGRASEVAARFKVSISAVSQWRTNGVPTDNILEVHKLSDGAVSLEELLSRPGRAQPAQSAS